MIKFHEPYRTKNEYRYIKEVLDTGKTGGDSTYTAKCEAYLGQLLNSSHVLLTTSGTHALELALGVLELKEGDEVILPSYTFTSTANAVLQNNGRVVFSEIDRETLCLDPSRMEEKITERTRAVIAVHYGGQACDMEPVMELADRYHLAVIEDAAQGFLSSYHGRSLGTIGHFGCFSFHETKNITCGEGGALSINRLPYKWWSKAQRIRQKGTNRSEFDQGLVSLYQWVEQGSSYSPSELLMAYLYAQLEEHETIQQRRAKVFLQYRELFEREQFPCVERYSSGNRYGEFNSHIFYVLLREEGTAQAMMNILKEKGIPALTHFVPLHLSEMGHRLGYRDEDFPVEQSIYRRLVRLPLSSVMEEDTIRYILEEVTLCLRRLSV